MSSIQLALILGPSLAVALAIAYLTRDDPITAKSVKQIEQQPFYRLSTIFSFIFAPIGVLLLFNNLIGAFLLILSGMILIFRDRLFPHTYWIRGIAAKTFGVLHIAIGIFLAFIHLA